MVPSSWNRVDHVATSRTSTNTDERLQQGFPGTYCTDFPGQFGWSTIAALTVTSLTCSKAESEEHEPEVLFFDVLQLHGKSSTGNSNSLEFQFRTTAQWYAYAVMFLSLLDKKTSRPMSFISDSQHSSVRVRTPRVS